MHWHSPKCQWLNNVYVPHSSLNWNSRWDSDVCFSGELFPLSTCPVITYIHTYISISSYRKSESDRETEGTGIQALYAGIDVGEEWKKRYYNIIIKGYYYDINTMNIIVLCSPSYNRKNSQAFWKICLPLEDWHIIVGVLLLSAPKCLHMYVLCF